MAHLQQQVLDAVVARLVAAQTVAGESVFLDRVDTLDPSRLPAILVEEGERGETVEPGTLGLEVRTLHVRIACVRAYTDEAASEARAFGLQVEKALSGAAARVAFGALCKRGWGLVASRLETSPEGDQRYGARVQDWRFSYFIHPATPDQAA